ncbi:MAG: YggS family pyridoxal phosphate enzyme [Candidatus Omnitrophica bacterium CG1_02_46_14]|nr:MAG: YggS family pyridoxal phosphate enzyme [Candidatus Omnitrophica bacterium CG1_02_46_14]
MTNALTAQTFKERLAGVQSLIDRAAQKTGRSLKDITLVVVTKGVKLEKILEARDAGVTIFGENRVQEATEKMPAVQASEIFWHLIGHLQSNKVKSAIALFNLIQSVDTVRLADKISREALAENRVMEVLLQVNISEETQKYGFKPEEIYGAIDCIAKMPGLRVLGLMGITANVSLDNVKRETFKKLKGIFSACKMLKYESIQMKYLSMGMSDDYVIAIEEGATMVRIGRALFK